MGTIRLGNFLRILQDWFKWKKKPAPAVQKNQKELSVEVRELSHFFLSKKFRSIYFVEFWSQYEGTGAKKFFRDSPRQSLFNRTHNSYVLLQI